MLTADGFGQKQFMPLWRDAMWHAVDPVERARLVLEMGRIAVREEGNTPPLLVAVIERREPPLVVMALPDLPSATDAPEVRKTVRERLAELGATEVYLLASLRAAAPSRTPTFVLTAWGETLEGQEVVWLRPFRWIGEKLEEAAPTNAPDARATEVSRRCAGLLTPHH